VHDVLSILAFLRRAATPKSIAVAGWGDAGPVVAAARALAGNAVDRAVVSTGGFRFGSLLDYRDPLFLPGSAKYLDVPGLLALGAPHPTWVAGESGGVEMVDAAYRSVGAAGALEFFRGEESAAQNEAVRWLLR
jgi:hypothetical protein